VAHVLDTAADRDVVHSARDERGREVDRLLRRAALAIDRRRGRLDREPRLEPRVAADVVRLLAVLLHAASDHVLHGFGGDPRALDNGAPSPSEQVVRMDVPVIALLRVPAADGSSNRLDDDDLATFHAPPTHTVMIPPLGLSVSPTNSDDSSRARKATVAATSSGRP
jgi:hypothetical protein